MPSFNLFFFFKSWTLSAELCLILRQRPCILPSPENKLPDLCQGRGWATCPSAWHRRGFRDRTAFTHLPTTLLVPAFSSPSTFRSFHQFQDILMSLNQAFSTVGLRFSFLESANLIITCLQILFLNVLFCFIIVDL